ncbi:hypothetical protein CHL67_08285 [Prosthecochloris sp. GSB1]|uniref:DUF6447 family protein n=1 Tax=Prosthecochloris sp. GSB1 TaxID=281093 RepID=UPI000B8C938C|nr:DUF6447 family protein [Prosthecochloris sp. GSB1]ASQ90917.1 hypothetical protein CHL67_08285 [Prosthecochloris sp. GSB1]
MTDARTTGRPVRVKVNDVEYNLADFSPEAREQLANLRYAESEIKRMQAQLAIVQTARNAYRQALLARMKEDGMLS